MKMKISKLFIGVLFYQIIFTSAWANELAGKWKTLDDKSGFPRATISIFKKDDGKYFGKIDKIYSLPNGIDPLFDKCNLCKGNLKDKPIIGLQILSNFTENPKNPKEFINGEVIDPANGNVYKGKIKMNSSGKRITLRGYVGTSLLGRSQTWIKMD